MFDNNYKKSDVLNEARNEALVEENTDLNVPSLSAVSKTEEGWTLIREKVEGTTLAELMTKNPNKLEEYMETFVDLQLTVHQQRVPTIKTLRHKLMDQINSVKELDATARYELATRLQGMPKHNKLCHGDFNPSNVIVDKEGKLWIIDWAHAGGALYQSVLQKGRHRPPVCQPLAANRRCRTAHQAQARGARPAAQLDGCH